MMRIRRLAALALAAGLAWAGAANAAPVELIVPIPAAGPAYSPYRYWTPGVARIYDDIHGPKISVYAPDRHPEIPPSVIILPFRCQGVDPAATLIEVPSAPATSRFRY
jgi:hypothetical protein